MRLLISSSERMCSPVSASCRLVISCWSSSQRWHMLFSYSESESGRFHGKFFRIRVLIGYSFEMVASASGDCPTIPYFSMSADSPSEVISWKTIRWRGTFSALCNPLLQVKQKRRSLFLRRCRLEALGAGMATGADKRAPYLLA